MKAVITKEEGYFTEIPGVELFYQVWRPSSPTATILITHGIGEHSSSYERTANQLAASGFLVVGWDVRGHGKSSGVRGHVETFSKFCEDLSKVVPFVEKKFRRPGQPFLLFGHSMGGLITLKTFVNFRPSQVDALILSSPTTGLRFNVPAAIRKLGRHLHLRFPKATFFSPIGVRHLTRDLAFQKEVQADALRHSRISFGIIVGTLDGVDEINTAADSVEIPVLMVLAKNDKLVCSKAGARFFEKVKNEKKRLVVYEHSRHEVFNDFDREDAISKVKSFIESLDN